MIQVRFDREDREELQKEKADRRLHPAEEERLEGSQEEMFAAESIKRVTTITMLGEAEALGRSGEERAL
jgi:hypothetical protein